MDHVSVLNAGGDNMEIFKTFAQIAGIGGVAIGAATMIFREVIRKNIFPQLTKADAYRVIRLISILVWSIAIFGIGAWVLINFKTAAGTATAGQIKTDTTSGEKSPIIHDTGNVNLEIK